MTPNPTPEELAKMKLDCAEAWSHAQTLFGVARMKAVRKAFPFSVGGANAPSLRVHWHQDLMSVVICDNSGFITALPEGEFMYLLAALTMESENAGAFRAFIEERILEVKKPPVPKRTPLSGRTIKLSDLGMD